MSATLPPQIHIHNHPPRGRWFVRILVVLLLVSVLFNLAQITALRDQLAVGGPPYEQFVQGDADSSDKIAILEIKGPIIPPYSDRVIKTIDRIAEDSQVRGVVVAVDSPGGLVVDSHRIYRKLQELQEKKPMVVSFGRVAASGGYYAAMGAGPKAKIFIEEAGWTGSIGVIIPRLDLSELSQKIGIASDSLKTGPMKDSLDPFKPLSKEERKVWEAVLKESLEEFIRVIDEARPGLDAPRIRQLATGQIFTATQSRDLKLVDAIGNQDDAIADLMKQLKISEARIVKYEYPASIAEALLGANSRAEPLDPFQRILEINTPRAMYYFGWDSGWQP